MNRDLAARKITQVMKRQFVTGSDGELEHDMISSDPIPKRHRVNLNKQPYNARHLHSWMTTGTGRSSVPHTRRDITASEWLDVVERSAAPHPMTTYRERANIVDRAEEQAEMEARRLPMSDSAFRSLRQIVRHIDSEIFSPKGFGSRSDMSGVDGRLQRLGYKLVLVDEDDNVSPLATVNGLIAQRVDTNFFLKWNVFLVPISYRGPISEVQNKVHGIWQV